ncbi:hypothetical protein NIES932_25640 [Raphidiopsis curvata NIES-932]|nr:hypothetical protein NIES932_25640 [Raphidiopsis curvata NIES-932]
MAAYSIPAAEHSTITAWGKKGEILAYQNMLEQFAKPGAVQAVVSDSYDLWNAIDHLWGDRLRPQVIDSGATVVIRPDSGEPVTVVSQALQKLAAHFGSMVNQKGYRVLNHVGLIQGDGVNAETITAILEQVESLGFSASNIAFGMGGALLQKVDRDTQKFAMKCSEITVAGQARGIYKDPITDPGKTSKKGRLALIKNETGYQTVPQGPKVVNCLQTVYENGELVRDQSLEDIRQQANLSALSARDN